VSDPLAYLFGLEQFGIKFGLDNIRALVGRLGHPERAFQSIHIAGTNGKGSVTAMIDQALLADGYRSARYTSPHLVHLEERFVIGGRPVDRNSLIAAVADVRDAVESLRASGGLETHPTFFEVTTAVGFELFRRAGVDVAVIEVGLGGRLDATNVVSPVATAITSIAMDHQQYLGSTLRDIAGEKAGIIKPHVPVVVGEMEPDALDAIAAIARERDADVIRASADEADRFAVGLAGRHQVANAAVAARVIDVINTRGIPVTSRAKAAGIAEAKWPGRLDLRRLPDGREALLDAAHNPAGAAALASYLHDGTGRRLPLVFAAMRDKDAAGMIRELADVIDRLVLTRASSPRSADPGALAIIAREAAPQVSVDVVPVVTDALASAWQTSPRIVIAGSIFLLGDVMEAFSWS
jgi:dihydrofolate synthase / folylpolyglutamate synthase